MRKLILEAGWSKFRQLCTYKAESAGKRIVFVDPCGTTQRCSKCGRIVHKDLPERVHRCTCGTILPRDYNSALNIKNDGLKMVGWGTPEPSCTNRSTLAEIKTSALAADKHEQALVAEARISCL